MIQLVDISKDFGPQHLFSNVSWHVDRFPRTGLVGSNGAGKSTLLKILTGNVEPDSGRVVIPSSDSIGYLAQEIGELDGDTALQCVLLGRRDLLEFEARIRALESTVAHTEGELRDSAIVQLGEVQVQFEHQGGYTLESRAKEIMAGLGFAQSDFERHPREFSGGWRMRLLLAQLLLTSPDLLLLDEPTNHLDLYALKWLETFLAEYPGTVVLIAHDRAFLNRSVQAIAALEDGKLRLYPGNYDAYVATRELEREQLDKQSRVQAKKVAETQAFIERFRSKATKAKQVQSRVKALEKLDSVEIRATERGIEFSLPPAARTGHVVVSLEGVRKAYDDLVVYESLDFRAYRGERIALVGPNGAGKSTLLKVLADATPFEGARHLGEHVEVGYFAQHQVESLNFENTVIQEMLEHNQGHTLNVVRGLLGAFRFSGEAVDKPIKLLSGGEKNRLALARLLLGSPNFLLMDEPTNHLDIASRAALERALSGFKGCLVFISHDRHFINHLATKILHVEHQRVMDYPGTFDEYEARRAVEKAAADEEAVSESGPREGVRKAKRRTLAEARKRRRDATSKLRAEVAAHEARIEAIETGLSELDQELARPSTYSDPARAKGLAQTRTRLAAELEPLMERWSEAQSELDQLDALFDEEEREADGAGD
ncbi:MAG: hypothetical protein CO108_15350 [Deltaproteobacteria bacterium CG_4_9_14_3_um_filter_63_12]|nr:MAG: hypothetical protein COW42_04375 [Deltaproteobacteria bacterium CG17_big_fil_post_rev_8_21_14_2_50_63_7]PJB40255.1 MAG: hypothetical protein CO108_15350 [Deltaproteobacteria bacterium CG_4_9_14_3_um_filter_63_12]